MLKKTNTSKDTLRVLLFDNCNRNCAKCCNKPIDLKKVPIVTDFSGYSEIMLTGGEPMLYPHIIEKTVEKIRKVNKTAKIILYTADVSKWEIYPILNMIDGITLTLHSNSDIVNYNHFARAVAVHDCFIGKSLYLNVFTEVTRYVKDFGNWRIKQDMVWLDDCPVPENEDFGRLRKLHI